MADIVSDQKHFFKEVNTVDSVNVYQCLTCRESYCGECSFNYCPICGIQLDGEVEMVKTKTLSEKTLSTAIFEYLINRGYKPNRKRGVRQQYRMSGNRYIVD